MKKKGSAVLLFLYKTSAGRELLRVLISPVVSKAAGRVMDSRLSALAIEPFVKANGIDLSQCKKERFVSYNDFFTRELQKGARPVDMEESSLVSPCDARLTVCPIMKGSRFWIKDSNYTLKSLLRDEKLARRYEGGTLWQLRLSVEDYHRYIYPADARKSCERRIRGVFHTVQPIALESCPVYKENSREYCLLKTKQFGTILMMEVGAMMVGRIENHEPQASQVQRGQEKGYFAFGGSTILLLTQKNRVIPRRDISFNSICGRETVVKQGEKIGSKAVWELEPVWLD